MARLERLEQTDEYVLLIPERDVPVTVAAQHEVQEVPGFALVVVPPGKSAITVHKAGTLIRIFSAGSPDLNALASNAAAYSRPHPNIPPFVPWPAPPEGFRLRVYDLDVAPQPGRFGRIWRCSTLMVNVHSAGARAAGPGASVAPSSRRLRTGLTGAQGFIHASHPLALTPDIRDWRDDDHVTCPAPSLAVIPPPAIHTSAGTDPKLNHLVDIFAPPRMDFSKMDGWVLNAQEYPLDQPR